MTSIYNPLIPTGLLFLSVDYKNIQNNFSWLNTAYNKNHVALTSSSNVGAHTFVQISNNFGGTDAGGIANFAANLQPNLFGGFETLYAGTDVNYPGVGNLFFTRGSGNGQVQLTGGPLSGPANNYLANIGSGWTFLPGGLILQFGAALAIVTSLVHQTPITFPIPFKTQVMSINCTPSSGSISVDADASLMTSAVVLTGFKINTNSDIVANNVLFWTAIGI